MATVRSVFAAAVKSLLRGKSFIQALLALWINPAVLKSRAVEAPDAPPLPVADFLAEAERLFLAPCQPQSLRALSAKLKDQFRRGLLSNPACMLPSYNHQLPHGSERGQYLVLDVGGSTLRVALAELRSRAATGCESGIVRMDSFKISPDVKALQGMAFFDWMAERIAGTLANAPKHAHTSADSPLPVGLAWSFPIEQTSIKGGLLHEMGKGFLAADGLLGQDLGDIIQLACKKRDLHIQLAAIVNDSTAALLSEAYINSSTRFSLILGTGVNISAYLPVPTIEKLKYGARPDAWFDRASHVLVNTELGMFGYGILPLTRWDRLLNAAHPHPTFQPLEQLVSGFYLGEICRHALVEAIDATGIFGGVLPSSLEKPYSLDTETLSIIEGDESPSLETAIATFRTRHPSSVDPTPSDLFALRALSSFISRRSASIVAACLFALWQLKSESEDEYTRSLPPTHPFLDAIQAELGLERTLVSFNGSVIENYPGYLAQCQRFIDGLVSPGGKTLGSIDLVAAKESSLLGAAVALACVEGGGAN